MNFRQVFQPKPTLSDEDIQTGLKWWTREGTASQGFWSITTSGFLAAYALALGCNNFQIGILAALPLLTQLLQLVFIPIIEKLKWRKLISFLSWLVAQVLWLPIAMIPIFLETPGSTAVTMMLVIIGVRGVFAAFCVCAWNSWMRDLIPQKILGSSFAQRQARATFVGMAFGLLAAFFVDYWSSNTSGDSEILGYTYALIIGIVFLGLASPLFILKIPEPLMQTPVGHQYSIISMLCEPFRDGNFRPLLGFLFFWGLALNLAIPFFAVYMLQRLELALTAVIGLSVLSQIFNILFLRVWGGLSDSFGIKIITALSSSLYLLVILGWTFTTMPERYSFTIPLLVILHILAGIASAGVTLGTGTIAMKVSPEGKSTSYLAMAAVATSLGAGLGPLLGGKFADYFSVRELSLDFTWIDPEGITELSALNLTGFDFLFAIAFILGLFTLNILLTVKEEGEVGRDVVLDALFEPGRQFSRPMTSVPGLNFLGQFPYGYLRRVPIPGLDVAVGVTAYQIAQTTKIAAEAAIQSGVTTARLTKSVQSSLAQIGKKSVNEGLPEHKFEIARQAVRGVIHALDEAGEDIQRLAFSAVMGTMRAFGWEQRDRSELLKGASYGLVQAADETNSDLGQAAAEAIEIAKDTARHLGMNEDEAMTSATEGILEAAEAISQEAIEEVETALFQETSEERDSQNI